ncbi:MAG: RNA-binding S4 domain-containing protein [Flavobacteriales bacterium]|nr:RNA-binding S4 domain-containing protein [Flavobacteriales bacterium]
MRLDKFLWSVRIFKTRSIATKACNGDQVKLNGLISKPSKSILEGDTLSVRIKPIWKTYQILEQPKSRVNAKLVPSLITETTLQEDLDLLKSIQDHNRENKMLGIKGRPTKKQRRDLDKFR